MNEPSSQHDRAQPEITGPVREYLTAILAAITVPSPAAAADDRAYVRLLENRLSVVTASLRGALDDGDVTFDVGYLAEKTREAPVTYEPYQDRETDGGQA